MAKLDFNMQGYVFQEGLKTLIVELVGVDQRGPPREFLEVITDQRAPA